MSGAPPGSPPRRPFGLSLKIQRSPESPEKGKLQPDIDLSEGYHAEPLKKAHTNGSGLGKANMYSIKNRDDSTVGIRKYLHYNGYQMRKQRERMINEINIYKYISSYPDYENYIMPILRTTEKPTIEMTDFYIDFPYINGDDLFIYLRNIYDAKIISGTDMKDKVTQNLLCTIFADIAGSIIFLHGIGVRHNDIKLANIYVMLNEEGDLHKAVLLDFDSSEIKSPYDIPKGKPGDYETYIKMFRDNLTLYCDIPLPAGVPEEVATIDQERAVLSALITHLKGYVMKKAEGGKRRYSRAKKTRRRRYRKTLKAASGKP